MKLRYLTYVLLGLMAMSPAMLIKAEKPGMIYRMGAGVVGLTQLAFTAGSLYASYCIGTQGIIDHRGRLNPIAAAITAYCLFSGSNAAYLSYKSLKEACNPEDVKE